jgi:site-specific recombinase XerD
LAWPPSLPPEPGKERVTVLESVYDETLAESAEGVIVRPMLTVIDATDLFLGDLVRRGYSKRTVQSYRRCLDRLCDEFPRRHDVSKVGTDDVRRFLNHWNGRKVKGQGNYSQGTRAHTESVVSSFFRWLYHNEQIRTNPMDRLPRTRRQNPQDLDVVTVSTDDVRKLMAAAVTWTEKLAIAIPAYMGARRRAAALLRLEDYDQDGRTIRFREKGNKVIDKPVPDELAALLDDAIKAKAIVAEPGKDYLIPAREGGYLVRADGDRDDRVIWKAVKDVAERAGVKAHVHALRAAFAVFYLTQRPGDVEALQTLMGHTSIATTERYLRRLERGQAMERVRTLSWLETEVEA